MQNSPFLNARRYVARKYFLRLLHSLQPSTTIEFPNNLNYSRRAESIHIRFYIKVSNCTQYRYLIVNENCINLSRRRDDYSVYFAEYELDSLCGALTNHFLKKDSPIICRKRNEKK